MNQGIISIFIATLSGGGAERVAVDLANGLCDQGWQVDVVVCDGGPMRKALDQRVRVENLRCYKVKKSFVLLYRYIRRRKPSVLLSIQTDCNLAALIIRPLAAASMPVVVTEHNVIRRPGGKITLGRFLRRCLQIMLYPRSDHLVAVSGGVLKDYRELLKLRMPPGSVIYNPVFSEKKFPGIEQGAGDHNRSLPVRPFILAVGRLVPQKGFDILIDAFSQISDKVEHDLIILGDGPDRGVLRREAERRGLGTRIALPGFVSHPYPYFNAASLFVLSSRWEGFGVVLAEALACGVPIVSTDCHSGPREILCDGKYGSLVPVGDPVALGAAIMEQLNDKELRSQSATQARVARAQDFSLMKAASRYSEIIESVTRNSGSYECG